MNVLLLIGLLYFNFLFQTEYTYKVADLRQIYLQAANEEKTYDQLVRHLAKYKGNDVMVQAFQAGITGLGAKYASGLYSKLKHVRSSANQFEKVVERDPVNPEIRFLRYVIEYHVPRYLLMSGNLHEDKKIVMSSLLDYPRVKLDPEAAKIMRDYFVRGDHCTESEKKQLRNLKL
ncbi:MAG: hypothetical protein AVDCRST_MAG95-814 [uncultured Adhaeribacter sp.]|uniref:Uncharacterized protein n=1 Tax=uncultured Adhaeribacter sp. TaxID=448109 RepID=A0A6J4HM13_9BACT|nr:MAG: hypothetical protein AVDCRST_MAG95-814 [uncultured Adhaeribacter sp.]